MSRVPLRRGPVVDPETSAAEAEKVASEHGVDWVGIADGEGLRGWVWVSDLDPSRRVGELSTRPFRVWLTHGNTLREALDAVVTSRTRVAVVFDEAERYLGMLTLEAISEEIL